VSEEEVVEKMGLLHQVTVGEVTAPPAEGRRQPWEAEQQKVEKWVMPCTLTIQIKTMANIISSLTTLTSSHLP
jgi:hypothetical protein